MKKLIMLFATMISFSAFANKKVLIMIPNDFMWAEYQYPYQAYLSAGFEIKTATRFKEEINPDRRNTDKDNSLYFSEAKAIKGDMTFDQVNVDEFDAVTFVGGNGAWHDFFPIDKVHEIVRKSLEKNKITALLCASAGLLAVAENYDGQHQPIAEGRKVVGHFRVEGLLKSLGKVKFIAGPIKEPMVVVDGNLITGRNPESSKSFGEAVVKLLK